MKSDRDLISEVNSSRFFDSKWYENQYPDIQHIGMEPAEHYLKFGARLGRLPSPSFSRAQIIQNSFDKSAIVDALNYGHTVNVPISIIIPVYNGHDDVKRCLDSVIKHTPKDVFIQVIDDCSPDENIKILLSKYTGKNNLFIHFNKNNLGFTRTVNRGIEIASGHDVIFLNADTIVTPGYVRNLKRAAYSSPAVGTATPFSDNAGAFSAPAFGQKNELPAACSLDEIARSVTRGSERLYPPVPTGNGFCMYVRRACIDHIGNLDDKAFPKGYGEENDFCMRAQQAGWENIIDDATYIHHVRSVSFGSAKTELMRAGRSIIDRRYPEYTNQIKCYRERPDITRARSNVADAFDAASISFIKPRIAFVTSTVTGGTPQTNEDLMRALGDRYETYLIRCDSKHIFVYLYSDRSFIEKEKIDIGNELKGFPHRSAIYDDKIERVLVKYSIELLHIRHIAWHSLGLVDVSNRINIPVVFSFHDFYTICPTVKLLDENDVYCKGKCTGTAGECRHELWPVEDFPALKHAAIHTWQQNMAQMLDGVTAFVTTTEQAARQIEDIYPEQTRQRIHVIPHGRDLAIQQAVRVEMVDPLRVLVMGNINKQKGSEVIDGICALDQGRTVEFHVLGGSALQERPGLKTYGRYRREDLPGLVADIAPDIGAVFSIWPETFCHTLTEMWASGVPVLGFDIGAVGERLRVSGAGWRVDSFEPESVLTKLRQIAASPAERNAKADAVRAWQRTSGVSDTTVKMSLAYDSLYRECLFNSREHVDGALRLRPRVGVLTPSRGSGSTQVRIARKILDSVDRGVRYDYVDSVEQLESGLISEFSALLVQRTAVDLQQARRLVEMCRATQVRLVYEIDDDLLSVEPAEGEQIDYSSLKEIVQYMLERADTVVVSTNELLNRYKKYNDNILVHENYLDEKLWFSNIKNLDDVDEFIEEEYFNVVYMGSKTHGKDLELIARSWQKFASANGRARLYIVGGAPECPAWARKIEIPDDKKLYSSFVPWFRAIAAKMDLSLAPLNDVPFNRGKSPLKFYEYMACGLDGLYSDVEPYHTAVNGSKRGKLVRNTSEDWLVALEGAYELWKNKKKVSENLMIYVQKNRALQGQKAIFDSIFLKN